MVATALKRSPANQMAGMKVARPSWPRTVINSSSEGNARNNAASNHKTARSQPRFLIRKPRARHVRMMLMMNWPDERL